jgi:hypothetical protein
VAGSDTRAAERRELARKLRREAYQAAKKRRNEDPRYLALKEEVKRRRREAYADVKAKRKAAAKVEKKQDEQRRTETGAAARAETYQELIKLVTWGAGSAAKN